MDVAALRSETQRAREAVRDHKVAAASHRKQARSAARRLGELEAACAKYGIELTVLNDHEAPKGEHGGDRDSAER